MNRRTLQDGRTPEPQPLTSGGANGLDEQAASKLLERYAVDEPDDLTIERVWQRVANPPPGSRATRTRLSVWIMAPAAMAWMVLLGLIVFRGPQPVVRSQLGSAPAPRTAELGATRGGVFFSRPAERWQPGRHGQALAESEWVRTDPTGMAILDVPGVASVLIAPETDLGLELLTTGTFLRLSRGSVTARVSKRPPGEPFVILTDRFSVKVVGTLFEVDQDASDRTAVSVREGTVEIAAADGRSWRVQAGQRWVSSEPSQLGASTIADSVKTLLEDGLRRGNPADLDRELEAVGRVSTVRETNAMPEITLAPVVDVPSTRAFPVRSLQAKRRANPRASASPPVVLAVREPMARDRSSSSSEPLAVEKAPAPMTTPDDAYAKGLALERRGQFEEAAAELTRAEKDDPSHADLALYALGRLYQHRLSNSQALGAFERYRGRYPQGALRPEVDLAVLEIEVQAGDRKEALAESIRFLASHPASERTDEVHLLRGNLLRDSGECPTALGEYAQVKVPVFAEAALYGAARCQGKLGNWSGERESLQAYRVRFPAGTHRDEVAKVLADETANHF